MKKPKISNRKSKGYSLVELVVVLAGLSILTTVSLRGTSGNNGILSWKKKADIDATKALLNATAADCLQKSRISSNITVDDSIISDIVLGSKGYIIDSNKTTCTSLASSQSKTRKPYSFLCLLQLLAGN
jgi:type II secretory pathway pseudopilin PulG